MSTAIMDGFETYIRTELCLTQETLSAYTKDAKEFLDFSGTQKLTAQLVETFMGHLRSLGYKPTTIRRKCMSIRCLYHHLISLGLLSSRTIDAIDSIRINRRIPNALDSKDVDILVATVEKRLSTCRTTNIRRDIAIILTMYHSGLRVSELCNLDIKDVNLNKREIRVRGKGGRDRVVPTTWRCAEAIKLYLNSGRQSKTTAVFVKSNGQRMTRRAISDMLVSISRRAGIRHTTAHMLRRSCATELMNRNIDLELIQALLGHQYLSTTQTYLAIDSNKLIGVHKKYHPFGDKSEV
jgi:integrase/recombinase XerC